MANQLKLGLSVGETVAARLRKGAVELDATEAECAAIERLAASHGTTTDVELVAPLAIVLNIPWAEMWG